MFPGAKFDLLSTAVTPIEMLCEGKERAHGTGFLWRHGAKVFLITNWHNVTGLNPLTGAHLSPGASVPDTLRIFPTIRVPSSDDPSGWRAARTSVEIKLFEDFVSPLWLQHKSFSLTKADIVALEVQATPHPCITLNDFGFEQLHTQVGSDLFVVGYPFRAYDEVFRMPIWKRGSIATEPLLDWEGKPAFLIDAASRRGMSGSPVIRRQFGPATVVDGSGELTTNLMAVVTSNFIGVYSGHLVANSAEITLGIAWHGSLISEMLDDPGPGTRD